MALEETGRDIEEIEMKEIRHCQVPLEEEIIEELKKATGKETIKDALNYAVDYCIKRYKSRLKLRKAR